jgi:hypothetical protein
MIFFNSAIFILFFILILFSILGYGLFLSNFLSLNNKDFSFGIYGILGLLFSTFVSYLTHIFFSHNIYHNVLFHFIGLIIFFYFFTKNYFLSKKETKKIFFLVAASLIFLFISKNNEDFSYYHLPYTANIVNHKLQFGIAHFNIAFRTPSSLFYLQSLFYLPYINYYLFHSSGLLILIFSNLFFLDKFFFNTKSEKNIFIKILTCLFFVFINIVFAALAKYGTDRGGQIISLVIFILILEILNNKFLILEKCKLIILFIIYLISIKIYFLPYLLLFLIILFLSIKFRILNKILYDYKYILFSLFFAFLFLFINFTNSGCLVYPLSFTCFENFSWSVTIESVNRYNHWYQLWSKAGAAPDYRVENPEEYVKHFNWVKNWINNYFFTKVSDTLGAIFLIIIYFLIVLRKINHSARKNIYKYLSLYLLIILFFFLWFNRHPDLRYGGYALLVSIFFIPLSLYLSKFNYKDFILKKFFVLTVVLVICSFNLRNVMRIIDEFKRNDNYKYTNFPFYHIDKVPYSEASLDSDIKVFLVKNHCWATPSPCLTQNIKAKKIYNYDFFSE